MKYLVFVLMMILIVLTIVKEKPVVVDEPTVEINETLIDVEEVLMQDAIKVYSSSYEEYARLIFEYSEEYKLNPWLVYAVIVKESSFRPKVSSYVGAQGLMQIMPFWKKEIGHVNDDLHHVETNLMYGCKILKIYLKRYSSINRALAGYNGSLGSAKYPNKIYNILKKSNKSHYYTRSTML